MHLEKKKTGKSSIGLHLLIPNMYKGIHPNCVFSKISQLTWHQNPSEGFSAVTFLNIFIYFIILLCAFLHGCSRERFCDLWELLGFQEQPVLLYSVTRGCMCSVRKRTTSGHFKIVSVFTFTDEFTIMKLKGPAVNFRLLSPFYNFWKARNPSAASSLFRRFSVQSSVKHKNHQ